MRHVREVLRLKFVGGVPTREIAHRIGVAASTVRATIKRFQAAGLSWPLPAALEARLFPEAGTKQGHRDQSARGEEYSPPAEDRPSFLATSFALASPYSRAEFSWTKASKGLPLTVSLHIPAYWTSEQAFAVFELVDDLREAIWRCYAMQLQDQYRDQLQPPTTMASRRSDARCHAKNEAAETPPYFFHP
jgi:hypothetical protein